MPNFQAINIPWKLDTNIKIPTQKKKYLQNFYCPPKIPKSKISTPPVCSTLLCVNVFLAISCFPLFDPTATFLLIPMDCCKLLSCLVKPVPVTWEKKFRISKWACSQWKIVWSTFAEETTLILHVCWPNNWSWCFFDIQMSINFPPPTTKIMLRWCQFNNAHLGILVTLDKDRALKLKLSSLNTSFFTLPLYIQFYHMWSPPGFNSCSSTLFVNLQLLLLLLYFNNTFKRVSLKEWSGQFCWRHRFSSILLCCKTFMYLH